MSDLARAVVFVFRKKGSEALLPQEFTNVLSFDLRWYSPGDARKVLALAAERGLVTREGERIRSALAPDAVEVPVAFRPGPEVLEEPAEATAIVLARVPLEKPLEFLAEASELAGVSRDLLDKEARTEQERAAGLLSIEAAVLVAAARRGVDVAPLARKARALLLYESG